MLSREQTAGPITIIGGKPRQSPGRIDYLLRLKLAGAKYGLVCMGLHGRADGGGRLHWYDQPELDGHH